MVLVERSWCVNKDLVHTTHSHHHQPTDPRFTISNLSREVVSLVGLHFLNKLFLPSRLIRCLVYYSAPFDAAYCQQTIKHTLNPATQQTLTGNTTRVPSDFERLPQGGHLLRNVSRQIGMDTPSAEIALRAVSVS